jgi:hypothetical protein
MFVPSRIAPEIERDLEEELGETIPQVADFYALPAQDQTAISSFSSQSSSRPLLGLRVTLAASWLSSRRGARRLTSLPIGESRWHVLSRRTRLYWNGSTGSKLRRRTCMT